jgi:hypothetical protein
MVDEYQLHTIRALRRHRVWGVANVPPVKEVKKVASRISLALVTDAEQPNHVRASQQKATAYLMRSPAEVLEI